MKKFSFLFAALFAALTMSATEVTVSIADYAAANGWENSKQYTSLTMDEVVTVTANPTTGTYNNTGKYYTNGTNWRMYQNEAPAIVVTAAEGYQLTSVTFTYANKNTGVMVDAAGAQVASGTAVALDKVASATFSVGNTDATVTNGNVQITTITVAYEAAVVEPTTETVYFVNAQNWGAVNAYVWDAEGNNGGAWPGVAATKEAEQIGGYDVYSYTADAGKYANVIFNNGSGDQTANLVWTAGKYYVIDGWYTKEEAEAKLAAPIADIWTVAGAPATVFGTEWDPANAENNMALQADGTYKWEKADLTLAASNIQFKVAKNNSWGEAYPADNYNLAIAEAGIYTITITFNADTKEVVGTATKTGSAVVIPTIAIAGDMNGWNTTANEFVVSEDELTASLTLPLEAQDYLFKIIVAGGWTSNAATITRENNTAEFTENGDNSTLTADVAGEYTFTWTYETKTLTVTYPKLPAKPEVVTEMVGIVKRAIQNGDNTIVLTHEADGTAHIYELANGTILELVQEGVVPVDPEDEYDYLAISDIATTEDGKLVATNYTRCNFGSSDYGTSYFYIWNNLDAAPTIWFKSNASSNSTYSDQGYTMAVKGTSTNAVVMTTGVHNTKRGVRMSQYTIIDGVYEDINNAGGFKTSEYYFLFGLTDNVVFNEAISGTNLELAALGENWVMDGNLIEPTEWAVPATMSENHIVQGVIAEGTLGKKYNGATYVTVGEQVLMVAPYADAEGKLAGVKILDVTAGFAAATEVATANLDAAVEATAAATAVAVAENTLTITLVADATIYTLNVELESEPEYWVIEDNITNLVIDTESMAIMGGPSTMWQVDVYLGLGQDNGDGTFTLTEESSVAIMGFDARFIDGYVYDIDVNAPAAKAVLHVEDNGSFYEIKLDMTNTPTEAIVVVVEDATVQIDTIPLFGDQVDYALKMTANWTYAEDGVTYPVLVEVPVYYPEATEPSEMTCTVTIGEDDYDPWLGFGEGTLTITTVDGVVTAKGIVANPYTGVAFDVTVSGKLPAAEPVKHTVTITVNPEGAGTVTGAGEYEDGAEVTVTAEENEGYIFLGWMEDGEFVAEDYEYTFTILNDVDLVAVYATQLVGVAEDLVITETALTATAILSTGTTLTVNLVLGEYDEELGAYWLAETTTLTLGDKEITLLDGFVMVNAEQQTAMAVVLAEHEGVFYAFTLVLAAPASGVDNINTNVAPRKVIRDGQLIIIKNGVEYNVQGAILK